MADENRRISVALTQDESNEIHKAARERNTSVSVLGQIAVRHLLAQIRNGAVPMVPQPTADEPTSRELMQSGRLSCGTRSREDSNEELARLDASINENDAWLELHRLTDLAAKGPPDPAGSKG